MVGDFNVTGIEIWAGFGPVGITGKKEIRADNEQFFKPVFSSFHGQKILDKIKNILVSALQSCIK